MVKAALRDRFFRRIVHIFFLDICWLMSVVMERDSCEGMVGMCILPIADALTRHLLNPEFYCQNKGHC